MDRFQARCDKLRRELRRAGVDGLLVTSFTNVSYLTGFTGDDSYLLVTPQSIVLLSDARYTTQLAEECPGLDVEIRPLGKRMIDMIAKVVKKAKVTRLGLEGESITLGLSDQIASELAKIELVTTGGLVESLRMVKDKYEIADIRQAVEYAERAFGVIKASIRKDQTEKEVADDLEFQLRRFGAKRASFETIVAVGARAALPHARPGQTKIGEADFVLIDWGADGGYKSDLTRVLVTGKIPPKLERVYGVVLKAQLQGIAAIRPGVKCSDVDAAARAVVEKAGFGAYFGHGLGHGIGLDIHEGPRLSARFEQPLEPGMVVTVEPGIYLPGWGGVRIEDDVLVTKTGHEVLTSVPKRWEDALVA